MTNAMMHQILTTVADSYDQIRPESGDGDRVRKFAEEKYPEDRRMNHADVMQHLANLCPRHCRDLLPHPTESTCADCNAEMESDKLDGN